ncbi:unnamed protein product [Vitrella brassicaformis CCMP3155]|uniref:Uncharacterized protein n=3 Tax=Vitrella brassicaformis TaxID=1169539 RepID=A0A0G4EHM4_VITBC|nr:unnamed protein product [Vitrella brassicaformis CCMP3155]|eukprot:CEL95520.1 unnamed protein product [Vitrella brassicaformis CCMP3155]
MANDYPHPPLPAHPPPLPLVYHPFPHFNFKHTHAHPAMRRFEFTLIVHSLTHLAPGFTAGLRVIHRKGIVEQATALKSAGDGHAIEWSDREGTLQFVAYVSFPVVRAGHGQGEKGGASGAGGGAGGQVTHTVERKYAFLQIVDGSGRRLGYVEVEVARFILLDQPLSPRQYIVFVDDPTIKERRAARRQPSVMRLSVSVHPRPLQSMAGIRVSPDALQKTEHGDPEGPLFPPSSAPPPLPHSLERERSPITIDVVDETGRSRAALRHGGSGLFMRADVPLGDHVSSPERLSPRRAVAPVHMQWSLPPNRGSSADAERKDRRTRSVRKWTDEEPELSSRAVERRSMSRAKTVEYPAPKDTTDGSQPLPPLPADSLESEFVPSPKTTARERPIPAPPLHPSSTEETGMARASLAQTISTAASPFGSTGENDSHLDRREESDRERERGGRRSRSSGDHATMGHASYYGSNRRHSSASPIAGGVTGRLLRGGDDEALPSVVAEQPEEAATEAPSFYQYQRPSPSHRESASQPPSPDTQHATAMAMPGLPSLPVPQGRRMGEREFNMHLARTSGVVSANSQSVPNLQCYEIAQGAHARLAQSLAMKFPAAAPHRSAASAVFESRHGVGVGAWDEGGAVAGEGDRRVEGVVREMVRTAAELNGVCHQIMLTHQMEGDDMMRYMDKKLRELHSMTLRVSAFAEEYDRQRHIFEKVHAPEDIQKSQACEDSLQQLHMHRIQLADTMTARRAHRYRTVPVSRADAAPSTPAAGHVLETIAEQVPQPNVGWVHRER